jgi:mannose-6-phosphate isomerase-like protein (cupin superfamily)
MGVAIGRLQAGGQVATCVHANERGIYILDGELEVLRDGEAFALGPDDFALLPYGVPHALRNTSAAPVRWFDMQSPQPKPPGNWRDMFFTGGAAWPEVVTARARDTLHAGHFVEQRPVVHEAPGVRGLSVHRFINKDLGAHTFFMMRGLLVQGGMRGYHDHPLEESYFVLSGEAEMQIEGKLFHLKPGDVAWTGVGTSHAFAQIGAVPFRWLETQAPQFPERFGIRNMVEWDERRALAEHLAQLPERQP